jgi:bifunctional non-homologous end joining protein LigD
MARRPSEPAADRLACYRARRDFERTAEPAGIATPARGGRLRYLVQKHAATRLHYDFRLELDGVLKSWAVTRGPSLDPAERRLAVQTEDHPLDYADFEGTIPAGQYGGGTVMLWDRGTWEPVPGKSADDLAAGHLHFILHGERMKGEWLLVRMKGRPGEKRENWLLRKVADRWAAAAGDEGSALVDRALASVLTGRTMAEIAADRKGSHSLAGKKGKAFAAEMAAAARHNKARAPRPRKAAPLPGFRAVQLATLVDAVPAGNGWLHEIKFDGYRALGRIDGDEVALRSRNNVDWSRSFATVTEALRQLPAMQAIVDGELCYVGADGRTDFQKLQNTIGMGDGDRVDPRRLVLYLFDLLYLDGEDLRSLPLLERKERLRQLVAALPESAAAQLRYSEHFAEDPTVVFSQACHLGLEGIIGKRIDAPYRPGRGRDWIKLKCTRRQEFVIAGMTRDDSGSGFRSLILAVNDDGQLRYCGKVGTGFSSRSRAEIAKQLAPLVVDKPMIAKAPRMRDAVWLRPERVCEVSYAEMTRDGSLRHASFEGLRSDKPPSAIVVEQPLPAAEVEGTATRAKATAARGKRPPKAAKAAARSKAQAAEAGDFEVCGVRISHPERVIDEQSGVSKLQLAHYHARVADAFLAFAADRPLSLVRCPQGSAHECFFQKHMMPGLGQHARAVKPGGKDAIVVDDAAGVIELVQFNVIELHGWGCLMAAPDKPDWIIFDLDPDVELSFADVIEAAFELREALTALELVPFVKTTGGKGLHVVVPLVPRAGWSEVKGFTKHVAETLERLAPERYVANMSKAKRRGRIFVDYLRNGEGATAVLPYSPRARPGAPVAMPIDWKDLPSVDPMAFTVATVDKWISRRRDPWARMRESARPLPDIGELLGRKAR